MLSIKLEDSDVLTIHLLEILWTWIKSHKAFWRRVDMQETWVIPGDTSAGNPTAYIPVEDPGGFLNTEMFPLQFRINTHFSIPNQICAVLFKKEKIQPWELQFTYAWALMPQNHDKEITTSHFFGLDHWGLEESLFWDNWWHLMDTNVSYESKCVPCSCDFTSWIRKQPG